MRKRTETRAPEPLNRPPAAKPQFDFVRFMDIAVDSTIIHLARSESRKKTVVVI
jgi:hypothetical protein